MPYVPIQQPSSFRFADFEYRGRSGELFRGGQAIHLPKQAALVLQALLEAGGGIVPREALKDLLWPGKVSGDFEGGLHVAVRKLRAALGDEGANPVLVGTLPGRGYRLLVEVETIQEPPPGAVEPPVEPPAGTPRWRNRGLLLAGAVAAAAGLWAVFGRQGIREGQTPGELLKDRASGLEFVWVPPGIFTMGSPEKGYFLRLPDENPHLVRLSKGFWIGRFEVTQRQYERVMGVNPSGFPDSGPEAPVENVSWFDAQSFIRKLNQRGSGQVYRLPTEAEWEYAARAGSTDDSYGPINTIAWYGDNSDQRTHPAGLKLPNAWGLYDTLGNVWEWCSDWYGPYLYQGETDPLGPRTGLVRVYRGGFWGHLKTVASRGSSVPPETRFNLIGFRVVCTPAATSPARP
jgi:formylglycine-generating enzyme required for sulfatase activity/DNA-binding winged helix-turn-helix (wHTH) protein